MVNGDVEEPDLDAPDLPNKAQRQLRVALPKSFIKKESVQIALGNDIQLRTTAKISGPQVCNKAINILIQRMLHQ